MGRKKKPSLNELSKLLQFHNRDLTNLFQAVDQTAPSLLGSGRDVAN